MPNRLRRNTENASEAKTPIARPTFWPAFWLSALLVGAKAFYLSYQSGAPPPAGWPFLAALAAISWSDVVFAAGLGVLNRLALGIGGRRAAATVGRTFAAVYLTSAAYGLVNLKVFGFFLTPLTYPLLCLAGDWRGLITSIMPFLTISLLLAALVAVALAAAVVSASRRLAERTRPARLRVLQAATVAAAAGWIGFGVHSERASWERRIDRRIAENAHWTFLASLAKSAAADAPLVLAERVRASDRDDFSTVAERDAQSAKSSLLRDASLGRASGWRGAHVDNVIVLILESVSARWLEIYGSPYPATPVLSQESKHALVFDNFYSPAGRSSDALAAILLSVQPRMSWRDVTSDYPRLPGTSLAEILAEQGYRTGFLTSSDLGWANWRGFLQDRGYQTVLGDRDLACGESLSPWGVEDRCLVDGMIRWLEESASQRFLLTAWTMQTHHPYEPPPGLESIDFFGDQRPTDDYDFGRYLNVLRDTDRELGRLFAALRERGLDQSTLVVIVGDHGESFGEPHAAYGHGTAIYEENVRVPMMLWSPRLFPRGGRSPIVGSHVELNQTIADLVGKPAAGSWQGRSLFDPEREPRAYFYVANDDYLLGIREERWKYILDVTDAREELYDLRTDRDEKRNVAKRHPEICRRMRQRLAARVEADHRFYAPLRSDQ